VRWPPTSLVRRLAPSLAVLAAAGLTGCATASRGGPGDASAVPGVRALEGRPDGALPYRLWLPESATPARPARLLVWLHPSTASMNTQVERLVEALAARGVALLVPTEKDFSGWNREEVRRLFEGTLPDAARTPGLDAARPALLGFSAGGQMALLLWVQFPGAFSGVAVVGAEPVIFGAGGATRELEPPPGEGARATPVLVLEGSEERGARMWRGVLEPWRAAGVPLELRIAPGRGHEWLLALPAERDAFLGWIEKLPSPGAR
jgi:alpha-beta hydrolase superfamily lysophospholipase